MHINKKTVFTMVLNENELEDLVDELGAGLRGEGLII